MMYPVCSHGVMKLQSGNHQEYELHQNSEKVLFVTNIPMLNMTPMHHLKATPQTAPHISLPYLGLRWSRFARSKQHRQQKQGSQLQPQ